MVRVRRSDCAAFSGEIHQSGMKRGGQVGVEGTISVLDCALTRIPEPIRSLAFSLRGAQILRPRPWS
jgi:hypothetical protein